MCCCRVIDLRSLDRSQHCRESGPTCAQSNCHLSQSVRSGVGKLSFDESVDVLPIRDSERTGELTGHNLKSTKRLRNCIGLIGVQKVCFDVRGNDSENNKRRAGAMPPFGTTRLELPEDEPEQVLQESRSSKNEAGSLWEGMVWVPAGS